MLDLNIFAVYVKESSEIDLALLNWIRYSKENQNICTSWCCINNQIKLKKQLYKLFYPSKWIWDQVLKSISSVNSLKNKWAFKWCQL